MKKTLTVLAAWLVFLLPLAAQGLVTVNEGRFQKGDNPAWSQAAFDDSGWQVLALDQDWNRQGVRNANGFGWYRIHVVIPSSLKKGMTDKVLLDLGPIDDADETWLNGKRVGKTGSNPGDPAGYVSEYSTPRHYVVDPKLVRWDRDNVIAVRVYNGGDPGGFFERPAFITKPSLEDFVSLRLDRKDGQFQAVIHSTMQGRGKVKHQQDHDRSG